MLDKHTLMLLINKKINSIFLHCTFLAQTKIIDHQHMKILSAELALVLAAVVSPLVLQQHPRDPGE